MAIVNKQALELQADRLERTLAVHGCTARVTGGTVTPRWVRFQVLPAMGTKVGAIYSLSEDLARALAVSDARVARRGAALAVEIPRADPQPVRLLPLLRQLAESSGNLLPVTACLGLDENGTPLLIRLPSPDVAHILIAGTTGSGKTVLLRAMALSLALNNRPRDLVLTLIDPRAGMAFDCLTGLPHLVRPVARDTEEAIEVLGSLVRLMEIRDRERVSMPHIVVMIDELTDLVMVGGQSAEHALTRLLQRGRSAGLHVIAATQKPTAAVIGSLVKALFPVRLVGKVASAEDAKVASGWRGTGAERLLGRGDFLAIAEGQVIRFQAALITEEEIAGALARQGWDTSMPTSLLSPVPESQAVERNVITLPDPPEPEPDPIDVLVGRLRTIAWDPDQSYLSACRALDEAEGGRPFYRVKEAVDRLRQGGESTTTTTLPEKESETDQRVGAADSLSGSGSSGSDRWQHFIERWETER